MNSLIITDTEIQIPLPISLKYSSLASVNSSYLGGQKTGTYLTPSFSSGTTRAVFSIALPIGVWNVCGHIDIQTTATITQYICGISEGSGLIAVSVVSQGLTGLLLQCFKQV